MCMKITKGIENCFGKIFSKWGELISRRGLLVSLLTLAIFMPLSVGWLRRTEFDNQQKAWSPEGNQALSDEKLSESLNLANTELFQLIYKAKDNRNVLTKDDFTRVLTLHQGIQQIQNGVFQRELCLLAGTRCAYSVHPAQFFEDQNGVITFPSGTEAQFLQLINSGVNPNPNINIKINLANMLGGFEPEQITFINDHYNYQSAKAIKFEYLISGDDSQFKEIIDTIIDLLKNDSTYDDYQLEVWSSRHFTEALDAGINNDIVIIQISIVLLVTYSLIVLGICHPVGLRVGAAGIGILCTMLAFVSAYGLCCAFGLKVTSIHQLLPFLLLGIGADDMYVITAIADQINPKMIISKRMSKTMRLAGVSIFITSLTDFVAFLVSASSALPALRSFVIFAGFGILFDFIFEITIYSSFLACDLQRQKKGKHQCFGAFFCKPNSWFFCGGKCIPKSQLKDQEEQPQKAGQVKVHNSDEFNQQQLKSYDHNELENEQQNPKKYAEQFSDRKHQASQLKPESNVLDIPDETPIEKKNEEIEDPEFQDDNLYIQNSFIQGCMKNCWSKFVTNSIAQVFILLFFAGLIAFAAWAAMQVTINFRLQFFVNSDHPLREYIRLKDKFFPNIGEPASYYTTNESDLLTEEGQRSYLKTLNIYTNVEVCTFCDQKWIVQGSTQSWYLSYLDYINAGSCSACGLVCKNGDIVSTQNNYHKRCLYEYFQRQGQIFLGRNILLTQDHATQTVESIQASRTNFSMINPGTSQGAVNAMDQLRRVEQDFGPKGGFFYSQFFITWEQYKDFTRELSVSLALALTSIFVIILLISGNFLISLFILINMGLIDLNLVALIWYWNLNLNFITMINLVLAVGLAVDYSAHIAHGYSQSRADKNCKTNRERRLSKMVKGLSKIGTSVFHGAFSTFLAIVTISASKSYVFEAFFKQWFGIILFGLLHGFILLPVVLTFFGPLTAEDKNHDDQVKAENKPEIVVQ